jgi:NADPH:quinone reductase-like Zn-dependent oxidoreductase
MQAATISAFGEIDVLEFGEVPTPSPSAGNVLIRVNAVGANYYDTLVRSGADSRSIPLPHMTGSDIVGRVETLGAGVKSIAPGDRVIVAPGFPTDPAEWQSTPENEAPSYFPTGTFGWGGYAQYIEVPALWMLRDETNLAPEELATIPLVLVTAVHAVKTLGKVGPGSRVLVQAGASGSGSVAIQVAKALGADVITTVALRQALALAHAELGAGEVAIDLSGRFESQIAVVLEERMPVLSSHFGAPDPATLRALQANGTRVIATATTIDEACQLQATGHDAIIADAGPCDPRGQVRPSACCGHAAPFALKMQRRELR